LIAAAQSLAIAVSVGSWRFFDVCTCTLTITDTTPICVDPPHNRAEFSDVSVRIDSNHLEPGFFLMEIRTPKGGQRIRLNVVDLRPPGIYVDKWDGRDGQGAVVSPKDDPYIVREVWICLVATGAVCMHLEEIDVADQTRLHIRPHKAILCPRDRKQFDAFECEDGVEKKVTSECTWYTLPPKYRDGDARVSFSLNAGLFTAPGPNVLPNRQAVTIVARKDDKKGTARVTLVQNAAIVPASAQLCPGGYVQFTAFSCRLDTSGTVWTLDARGRALGTIDRESGVFHASLDAPSGCGTVSATLPNGRVLNADIAVFKADTLVFAKQPAGLCVGDSDVIIVRPECDGVLANGVSVSATVNADSSPPPVSLGYPGPFSQDDDGLIRIPIHGDAPSQVLGDAQVRIALESPPGCAPAAFAETDVTVATVEIAPYVIDHDDPARDTYAPVTAGSESYDFAAYGGAHAYTSDFLQFRIVVTPRFARLARATWTVSRPDALSSPPPAPSPPLTYNAGRVQLKPGPETVSCHAEFFGGGDCQKEVTFEVGVRTDDVIVLGWINGSAVALGLPTHAELLDTFPQDGQVGAVGGLQGNLFMVNLVIGAAAFPDMNGAPVPLTIADRTYILNWMFKYSANPDPSSQIDGGSFLNSTTGETDESKISDYLSNPHRFKLFNRLQVRFLVDTGDEGSVAIRLPLTVLHRDARIGVTLNPFGRVLNFLDEFPGQAGPFNDRLKVGDDRRHIAHINDGSPDSDAIKAFDTLTATDLPSGATPVWWENIGSQIRFRMSENMGATAFILTANYPTYYIYTNGRRTSISLQAASELEHLQPDPYPFGPGGRSGDASSPPANGARRPPWTIPDE